MRKSAKYKVVGLVILLAVSLCACSQEAASTSKGSSVGDENKAENKNADEQMTGKEEKKDDERDKNAAADSKQEEEAEEEKVPSPESLNSESAKGKAEIYYSNDDATGFLVEEVETENLSAESLFEKLAEKGVVSDKIKVLSCEETYDDAKKVIILDLSLEFQEYLQNFGLTGERITIQSICNTFIKAYGCSSVKITVAGEILTTNHAEYPGFIIFAEEI